MPNVKQEQPGQTNLGVRALGNNHDCIVRPWSVAVQGTFGEAFLPQHVIRTQRHACRDKFGSLALQVLTTVTQQQISYKHFLPALRYIEP